MKLSEYSKRHGICNRTAWNHFKRGLISGAYQLPSGRIVIPEPCQSKDNQTVVILFSGQIEELIEKLK